MKLSIVIPVYNEQTIGEVVERVSPLVGRVGYHTRQSP